MTKQNQTITVNRLPAKTWNWLKMNAARLEANAPAVGAAPSFVQTAQLARSSAAQDWAMETGMGTDVDRFLANSPAEYLTLGENEVMDAPAAPPPGTGCTWKPRLVAPCRWL